MDFNDVIIRDYQDADYDEIVKLWSLTNLGNPARGDTKETVKRTLQMGAKLLVMVSKPTGKICGTSWMTYDGRRILLHHFGILPEFQGQGLSKILLGESLRFVKSKGAQIKLEVHSDNLKAVNLYRKFGFKLLSDFDVYIIRDVSNM